MRDKLYFGAKRVRRIGAPLNGRSASPRTYSQNWCWGIIEIRCRIACGAVTNDFMLNREQKAKLVEELDEKFKRQRLSIFADFRGISVAKLTQFRRELKKIGAEFKVAKKTLLKLALEKAGPAFSGIEPKELNGEIGIIFGYEEQIAPAKAAARFSKENETFRVLKGVLAGKILEARDVLLLAKLPGREQLLAQLARTLNAPLQNLVNVLQGNIRNLVVVLNQIKSKK